MVALMKCLDGLLIQSLPQFHFNSICVLVSRKVHLVDCRWMKGQRDAIIDAVVDCWCLVMSEGKSIVATRAKIQDLLLIRAGVNGLQNRCSFEHEQAKTLTYMK
jgi:hypothetical protein